MGSNLFNDSVKVCECATHLIWKKEYEHNIKKGKTFKVNGSTLAGITGINRLELDKILCTMDIIKYKKKSRKNNYYIYTFDCEKLANLYKKYKPFHHTDTVLGIIMLGLTNLYMNSMVENLNFTHGKTVPGLTKLREIAEVYNTTPGSILNRIIYFREHVDDIHIDKIPAYILGVGSFE